MKRLFLAVLLLAMPLAPVGWTGMTCTSKQQQITYQTLATIGSAVNTAYSAYMDQVVSGRATLNPSVAKAYDDFQKAYAVAVSAASMNPQAIAPQNVIDLANTVLALVKQFSK